MKVYPPFIIKKMVLLQTGIQHLRNLLQSESFSTEYGELSSVKYRTTALDSVHTSKTDDIYLTAIDSGIKVRTELDSNEGNSETVNTLLIKVDDNSFCVLKHNNEDKTENLAIEYHTKIFLLPDYS